MVPDKLDILTMIKGLTARVVEYEALLEKKRDEIHDIDFTDSQKWLNMIFDLVRELKTLPLGLLPMVHVEEVTGFFTEVLKDLGTMAEFSTEGLDDPRAEWDALVKRIKRDYIRNYENISPYFEALKG